MFPEKSAATSILRVVLTLVLLCAGAAHAQEPAPLLQQAAAALEKADYAVAAKALEEYLPQNPEDFRAEFNLAYAYSMMGRRSDAIGRYRNVLNRQKDLTPARLNLGMLLVEEGQATEAVEHLRYVVEKEPNNFRAAFYLARAFSALQQLPDAREAYERALALKPDDAEAHTAYAQLLAESNPAAAEQHLRAALQADPSLDDASLLLASVLESQGSPESLAEAAELYRRYLDAHPDRPESPEKSDLRVRLGRLYAAQQRTADAIAQWEAARAAGDSSGELARLLLDAYLRGGEPEKIKASDLLDQMLTQNGNDAELWLLAGRLRMEKRQYLAAAERFLRATVLQPERAEGHINLASALYLLKDYERTVAALARVATLGQDTAGTYFLRAISLDQLRQQAGALENYQRFLERADGKNPNQEFQARQRIRILTNELRRRGSRRR
jgi:tetratricopeptide (TPR) repeat protein